MFIDDKLVFTMWKNRVMEMIAGKTIVAYVDKRKKELGIE